MKTVLLQAYRFSRTFVIFAVMVFGIVGGHSLGQVKDPSANAPEFMERWQSLRGQLRDTIAPLRKSEYEFRFLARGKDKDSLEQVTLNNLPARIIVILGGLQGDQDSAEQFAKSLERELNYPANTRLAIFDYPNDGSIQESGAALRDLLLELHKQSPKSKVSIVAHSMGGLVSRWALEPPVEPGQVAMGRFVDHLTMIFPPNHGSVLAQYADVLEISDAMSKMKKGKESFVSILTALIDDGLGEACDELTPESKSLGKLNAMERAKGVRYTVFAGTRGPVSPLIALASSVAIDESRARTRDKESANVDRVLTRVKELLTSDELSAGLGDGAVAIESARLPGVSEFITLPIQHADWAIVDRPEIQDLLKRVALNMVGA